MRYGVANHHKSLLLLVLLIMSLGAGKMVTYSMGRVLNPAIIFPPDSGGYINSALAILKTGCFAVSPEDFHVPQVERTPGYPFFIASLFFFFGENYALLIVVQIMLSLGTIVVTYIIAAILWDRKTACMSALLLSLDIPSFLNSEQVLTDTLFTFVLSIAVIVGVYALIGSKHAVFLTFVHGALLSLATLIRPIAYYAIFPVALIFMTTLKVCFGWQWKKIVCIIFVLLSPWVVLVGGWQIRNYVVVGSTEFSAVVGWNLLFCRGADIIAHKEGITFEEARQRLGYGRYAELFPETESWSISQLNRRWKREGLRLIFEHPGLFIKSQARGALTMMLGTGWRAFLRFIAGETWEENLQGGPAKDLFLLPISAYVQKWVVENPGLFAIFLFAETYLLGFYMSVFFTIWQLTAHRRTWKLQRAHILLFLLIGYLFVLSISAGPVAYFRFRIPIMPLLSVYAGHGACRIFQVLTGN